MAQRALTIARAARPFPGESSSGDLVVVDWHDEVCRISLLDGLGHGPEAAAAAAAGEVVLASHPSALPEDALRLCHRALAGTRGAAMLVLRVDPAARRLSYAGVGNVEAILWQSGHVQHLVPARGIVGAILPNLRAVDLPLEPEWLLLVHTDGISARFDLAALAESVNWSPQELADLVLSRHGRQSDDATVVVARPPVRDSVPAPLGNG